MTLEDLLDAGLVLESCVKGDRRSATAILSERGRILTVDVLGVVSEQLEDASDSSQRLLRGMKRGLLERRTLPSSSSALIHLWQGDGLKLDG